MSGMIMECHIQKGPPFAPELSFNVIREDEETEKYYNIRDEEYGEMGLR